MKLKVLWFGCGAEDFARAGIKGPVEVLTKYAWGESGAGHSGRTGRFTS